MTTENRSMTMTAADYAALQKAVEWNDGSDYGEFGDDTEGITTTREPLSAFDEDRNWRECDGRQRFDIDGHPCVYWQTMQAVEGQRRESLTVIDLGDFRACYKA